MAPTLIIPPNPPTPLSQPLRTDITNALLATSTIPTLQTMLLAECHEIGWLDTVRERALQLIRTGECVTYGEVMGKVVGEAKVWGTADERDGKLVNGIQHSATGKSGVERNGAAKNGINSAIKNGVGKEVGKDTKADVRVPDKVVREGVRVVKAALDKVVKIEEQED